MKKIIAILLCLTLMLFLFTGCNTKEIISKKPMEIRYTPSYTGTKSDMYVIGDDIIPITKTITYPETYEVRYFITYEDKCTTCKWIEVDKETYEKARDKLP